MIVAGIGCRAGCSVEDVLGALSAALLHAGLELTALSALSAPEPKRLEKSLSRAAEQLGKPLLLLAMPELEAQSGHALTRSARVVERFGVPSVAETAALAGVLSLSGGQARLLAPRHAVGGATCALASSENPP